MTFMKSTNKTMIRKSMGSSKVTTLKVCHTVFDEVKCIVVHNQLANGLEVLTRTFKCVSKCFTANLLLSTLSDT